MYQRKRATNNRDVPADSNVSLTAGAPSLEAGTVGADGVGAPQSGGVRVPNTSPSDTPSADANVLMARLREAEGAVAMLKAEQQAHQRRIEMAQGGRELSPEAMASMRETSDRREKHTQGRLDRADRFLKINPQLADRVDSLGQVHEEAMMRGISDESDQYHALLEERFGPLKRIRATPVGDSVSDGRNDNFAVSAPVSRSEAPNYSTGRLGNHQTKITLTPEEREACRYSGVDETTYAKEKLRMIDFKARGLIQDTGR